MINILNQLNENNGSNYKIDVLKEHKDNDLLQRLLKMTYDKVAFTYNVTMKNIPLYTPTDKESLAWGLELMAEELATRNTTGNDAIKLIHHILSMMSKEDANILEKVLNRDLRINMGRTQINKVFKNLIVKPPYMRCDIGTEANVKKNINFKKRVFSEVKMDGTYRACTLDASTTTVMSRPGNEDDFPIIEKEIQSLEVDGYTFLGEMTLRGEQDRSVGNGIINSITERAEKQDQIIFTVWDMIPAKEYSMDKDQIKEATKNGTLSQYGDRLDKLEALLKDANLQNVELIEYKEITSMKEAYEHFQEVTERGDEGTVIKTEDMVWKDGTSKQQLKVKLVISAEVRVTGFVEGKPNTKRTETFGSLMFENDEGTIKGSTSGFTDELLELINNNRQEWIGKVIEVEFNDITKSRSNDFYAFSHPRFIADRSNEKDSTDTLERCLEMKEMEMNLF